VIQKFTRHAYVILSVCEALLFLFVDNISRVKLLFHEVEALSFRLQLLHDRCIAFVRKLGLGSFASRMTTTNNRLTFPMTRSLRYVEISM